MTPLLIKEILPYVSAVCLPNQVEALEQAGYVDLYVLEGPNKIMRKMKLSHGREVVLEVKSIPDGMPNSPNTPALTEKVSFFPGGKIPILLLNQIKAFFKEVCEKHGEALEAHCYIMWNAERGYYIFVPEQTVSGAAVEFKADESAPEDAVLVDIHSHGSMSAFFSSTDDNNDKKHIYFSGAIGKVNTGMPEIVFRFNMYEVKKPATLGDIFMEVPVEVTVPSEWLDKVKKREVASYVVGSWQGNQGNFQGGFRGTSPTRHSFLEDDEDMVWRQWGKELELARNLPAAPLAHTLTGTLGKDQKKKNKPRRAGKNDYRKL